MLSFERESKVRRHLRQVSEQSLTVNLRDDSDPCASTQRLHILPPKSGSKLQVWSIRILLAANGRNVLCF
jgi:hypothetical protein